MYTLVYIVIFTSLLNLNHIDNKNSKSYFTMVAATIWNCNSYHCEIAFRILLTYAHYFHLLKY